MRAADISGHTGFIRTINRSSRRQALSLSIMVVMTLAVAILLSAVALRLDDDARSLPRHTQAAAWNVIHGVAAVQDNGG